MSGFCFFSSHKQQTDESVFVFWFDSAVIDWLISVILESYMWKSDQVMLFCFQSESVNQMWRLLACCAHEYE